MQYPKIMSKKPLELALEALQHQQSAVQLRLSWLGYFIITNFINLYATL